MLKLSSRKKCLMRVVDGALGVFFKWINNREKLDLSRIEKVLFVELWGIGDIILATPALKTIRAYLPRARITVLAKGHSKELLKNSQIVDRVIVFDFPWTKYSGKYRFWNWNIKGLFEIISNLHNEKFDLVLDARMDFRNNLLMWLIGAKRRVGYDLTGGGYFLTDVVPIDYTRQHRVDEWTNLLKFLGIEIVDSKPELWISDDENRWAERFLADNNVLPNEVIIGIHPGARIKKRCWPLERFGEVSEYVRDRYNAKVIVFIEPDGYGSGIPIKGPFVSVKISLRELIALISELDILMCNDGGAMHISTAVDTPVIAIFGPGDVDAIGPYGNGHKVVIKEEFPCRPCYDHCRYKEPYCVTEIKVDDVIKVIDEKLRDILTCSGLH